MVIGTSQPVPGASEGADLRVIDDRRQAADQGACVCEVAGPIPEIENECPGQHALVEGKAVVESLLNPFGALPQGWIVGPTVKAPDQCR